jgi:prevent-host-death family protein
VVDVTRTIPHRELRNNSAAVLREVQAGETFEITNHGEVVAILSPPAKGLPPLRVRPARAKRAFSGLPRVRLDRPSQDILDELREERL